MGRAPDTVVGRDRGTVKTGNGKEENLDNCNMNGTDLF